MWHNLSFDSLNCLASIDTHRNEKCHHSLFLYARKTGHLHLPGAWGSKRIFESISALSNLASFGFQSRRDTDESIFFWSRHFTGFNVSIASITM